jgi:hypothetical protein
LNHYIVYMSKRVVVFAPNCAKKSPFLHAWLATPFSLCWFKHNNGYLCLWQGLLVLFEGMVVNEHHFAQMHRLGKNFIQSCVVEWVIYIWHVAMDMNTFYDAKQPLIYY